MGEKGIGVERSVCVCVLNIEHEANESLKE